MNNRDNNAAYVLHDMAETYTRRNKMYGNNYKMIGPMMEILFPDGVGPAVLHSDQFHLFELILIKLSRFAVSELQHRDSIHDAAVYGAMIEAILLEPPEDSLEIPMFLRRQEERHE